MSGSDFALAVALAASACMPGAVSELRGDAGLPGKTPLNGAPTVALGAERQVTLPASLELVATAADDGLPEGSALSFSWSVLSGATGVVFDAPDAVKTSAHFSSAGTYGVQLSVSDGELSAVTQVVVVVSDSLLIAPSSLVATPTTSSIVLGWTDESANETGFEVQRATGAARPFVLIGAVGAQVTSFTDSGLSPNSTLYYRVRAQNGALSSPFSNVASATTTPALPRQIPVLIAQGMMGRTMLSCDDGRSWVRDRSFDREEVDAQGKVTRASDMVCGDTQQVRCEQSSCKMKNTNGTCSVAAVCDCGHHSGYAKGVAFGKGQIVANFGWGHPGVMLHSEDGASWGAPHYFDARALFPNVAFGSGRFVHFSGQPEISEDGVTWTNGGFANINGSGQPWTSPRAFDFLPYSGDGRFIGVIDGDLIRVSADRGNSWQAPTSIPPGCADGIGNSQQILTGNSIAVIVTSNGKACRTVDGGITWTLHSITNKAVNSWGVFVNGKFLVWTGDTRFSSADGVTWTAQAMTAPTSLGVIGVSTAGTLVATNSVWLAYEDQEMLRSADEGLTWSKLAPDKFRQGHAIHRFAAGTVSSEKSICP